MSKIQQIRQLSKEGKGNQKMIDYLLLVIDGLTLQLQAERMLTPPEMKAGLHALKSGIIEKAIRDLDSGQITPEQYIQELKRANV